MNPETLDLAIGVIEELIAAIPQIVVVLTTVVYSLNAIRSKVNTFPTIAKDTQKSVDIKMIETQKQINQNLEQSKFELSKILELFKKEVNTSVNGTLTDMEKELSTYKGFLKENIDQTNLLVRQNKLFMDVIIEMVAKDPKKVNEGIAQAVSTKINLSKEQLEQYPQLLVNDIKVLEGSLKEAYGLIGKEKFAELLKKIGYGK
jgi:hypothetical protein